MPFRPFSTLLDTPGTLYATVGVPQEDASIIDMPQPSVSEEWIFNHEEEDYSFISSSPCEIASWAGRETISIFDNCSREVIFHILQSVSFCNYFKHIICGPRKSGYKEKRDITKPVHINMLWKADIHYVSTSRDGMAYFMSVKDCFSKRLISNKFSRTCKQGIASGPLRKPMQSDFPMAEFTISLLEWTMGHIT